MGESAAEFREQEQRLKCGIRTLAAEGASQCCFSGAFTCRFCLPWEVGDVGVCVCHSELLGLARQVASASFVWDSESILARAGTVGRADSAEAP